MEHDEVIENLIKNDEVIEKIEKESIKTYKELFNLIEFLKPSSSTIEELKSKPTTVDNVNQINKLNSEFKKNKIELNLIFEGLLKFSKDYNYFFCYSPLKTYEFYFESFYWNFKRIIKESEKLKFYKYEYEYHLNFQKNEFLIDNQEKTNMIHRTRFNDHFSFLDIYPFLFGTNKLKIKNENEKILSFVKDKILELGYKVKQKSTEVLLKRIKDSELPDVKEASLGLKDLPDFDIYDRYKLVKELGIDRIIENLDTSKASKAKVLSLIMKIHPSTSAKLLNNTYPTSKRISKGQKKELWEDAERKVNSFFENPNNDIKIP